MSKVLLVVAHPNIASSIGNKTIIAKFKTLHPDVEIDELYKLYPDFKIDVKKEQEKLLKADYIILQFPMFWYNAPALMRQWFESVLEHGFAYGSKGKALEGKQLIFYLEEIFLWSRRQSHVQEHLRTIVALKRARYTKTLEIVK